MDISSVLTPAVDKLQDNSVVKALVSAPPGERITFTAGFSGLVGALQALLSGQKVTRNALSGTLIGAAIGYTLPDLIKAIGSNAQG
ncbi:MAG TPA: hypothetical protein PKV43_04685 [Armatimonadota bacterium]|nr:hypothetical protein [Armatimonadota bacterium]